MCDKEREMTEEERVDFKIGTKESFFGKTKVVLLLTVWLCTVKHSTMFNLSTILYCFMVYRLC